MRHKLSYNVIIIIIKILIFINTRMRKNDIRFPSM